METHAEILMSNRELGCRRVNQQSQRYLDSVVKQLDYEKKLVQKDWDHKMKVLVAQKKKVMPQGWDPLSMRRPRTAWVGNDAQNKVGLVSETGLGDRKIPGHWKLCASYRVTASGQRIRIPITSRTNSAMNWKQSSRPRTELSRSRRRVASAPVRDTSRSSFLVTQQVSDRVPNTEEEKQVENVFEENIPEEKSDVTPDSTDTAVNKSVQSKPPTIRNRPVSAGRMIRKKRAESSQKKTDLNSNSGSSLDSAGSFTLLRQVIEQV